uniref:LRRCT domain-containing protein n=1 Tax=Bracon brevicornis TaxID=1563983 RepID=A0A6V7KS04_9HYME
MTRDSRLLLILSVLCLSWHSATPHHYYPISFPILNPQNSIQLSSSQTTHLQTGKCEDYPYRSLTLTLPGQAPTTLYPGFIDSSRVSCLTLTDGYIERINSNAFVYLTNLLYLDLSRNRIQLCDLLTFSANSLKTLVIDENTHGSQDVVLTDSGYFPNLQHLYLRKNSLRDIRINLRSNFPSLTHLYLSDNQLDGRSIEYLQLPSTLTHLHLERNWIYHLDTSNLIGLTSLFLDGNRLGSVCSWLCQNHNSLALRRNSRMKFLSLSANEINHVDRDSFIDLTSLQSLNLAHNKISYITPGTFNGLHQLSDLSLSHNSLTSIPDLRSLGSLASLSLDHNYIGTVHTGAFGNFYRLLYLSLGSNRINCIETSAFTNLQSLKELDLSDNQLSYLPSGWISNTCLEHLDIRNNRLTSLDSLSIPDLLTLTHIYVQGNPLSRYENYWWINPSTRVHIEYNSSVRRGTCYVQCDSYSIPRVSFADEWVVW